MFATSSSRAEGDATLQVGGPHQNALGTMSVWHWTMGCAPSIITHIDVEPIDVYVVPTDEWCSGPTDPSQMFLDRILQRKCKTDPLGSRGLNNNCGKVTTSSWATKN